MVREELKILVWPYDEPLINPCCFWLGGCAVKHTLFVLWFEYHPKLLVSESLSLRFFGRNPKSVRLRWVVFYPIWVFHLKNTVFFVFLILVVRLVACAYFRYLWLCI